MRNLCFLLLLFPFQLTAQQPADITRWKQQASRVTIIRDNYGIPHIYGKSDADAVFGLLYAQCEDDFNRVEMNYIEKLGRMAEVKGKSSLYDDLLIRMMIDSTDAIRDYKLAAPWFKKLMDAFADGINYYLYKHPGTKPALLHHFQPWYTLLWTDGSIGAINTADIKVQELASLYGNEKAVAMETFEAPDEALNGSNGFAFAPSITKDHHAILYINPHVTMYFRPEVHMVSEEGLNVYGAVTWGQFFIYQGFNQYCGWMHTSSKVDAADTYQEKISNQNGTLTYLYEGKQKPVTVKKISLQFLEDGTLKQTTIDAMYTHHGPVMAHRNDDYLSLRADNRITNGLIQCWLRNKARSLANYQKTLDLLGNISNNTVYADAAGNIAYWHGNRIPVRNTSYNWNKPVDGTIAATEWKGYHPVSQTVHILNPANGWLQNCNSTPFSVAGSNSPKKEKYPAYMAPDAENFRGINAVRVLNEEKSYTIDKVIKAGYDPRLAAFEMLIPAAVKAFEKNITFSDTLYGQLTVAIDLLKNWDYRVSDSSIATGLAIEWGEKLLPAITSYPEEEAEENDFTVKTRDFAANAKPMELLLPLLATVNDLMARNGCYQIPWGDFNRFQRITDDIDNHFDDNKPSFPMGYTSSTWGQLPSFVSRTYPGTTKRYGFHGNSFICVVEFGPRIKARSLLAGGESGNPESRHFFDQGEMYTKGIFKEVLFYKEDVRAHQEKQYHPGAE